MPTADTISFVIGVDPGPAQTAWVLWNGREILHHERAPNASCLHRLKCYWTDRVDCGKDIVLAIEMIASYGMPVGAEVFETCVWIGRFVQTFDGTHAHLIPRLVVKQHLCHDSRAKDSNIRRAIIDRFGGPATIRKGGPLYGIAGDEWSALALALTFWDSQTTRTKASQQKLANQQL
jgi:hypothetical protein